MKEKGVTKTALILLVLVCVFAIVACSDKVDTNDDVCNHIYTEKADATYLKSAATCTEKAVCEVCNTAYGEALGHEAQDVWSTDADNHWHKCTRCEEQLDKAAHSGGTATCTEKAVCEVCNTPYGNTAAHEHGSEWHKNADEHWNECECGDKANVAPHADANNDGKCDTCEYAMGNAENLGENIESEKTGLSGGAIAGIAVGSVAGAALLGCGGFAIFWFVIKKKKFADLIALFKKK